MQQYTNYRGRVLSTEPIKELTRQELFVFGSNLEGKHNGGAARYAHRHFGAIWGQGTGPQGQCYAIPTMFNSVKGMKPYVDEFVEYVKAHPMNRFLITRLGCGVAGFRDNEVAPLFYGLRDVNNAVFSIEWWSVFIVMDESMGYGEKDEIEVDGAIDENRLVELSRKYRYEIGAGLFTYIPDIMIRYVVEDDKFGYKRFGKCFFFHSPYEFYVCDNDEKWKDQHSLHILLDEFNDECPNLGYVRRVEFAGVRTPFRDIRGDFIYTGDIVRAYRGKSSYVQPVSTFHGEYAFVLDNHCLPLSECSRFDRLGTVFYGLDSEFNDCLLVNSRNGDFFGSVYGYCGGSTLGKELIKSRLTPNYIKDDFEYIVLNTLKIEYNWRH